MSATTASAVHTSSDWQKNLDTETLRFIRNERRRNRIKDPSDVSDWTEDFVKNATTGDATSNALYFAEVNPGDNYESVKAIVFAIIAVVQALQARGMDISENLGSIVQAIDNS